MIDMMVDILVRSDVWSIHFFAGLFAWTSKADICRPCSEMEIEWLRLTAAKIIHSLPKNTMDCDIFRHVQLQSLGYIYKRR